VFAARFDCFDQVKQCGVARVGLWMSAHLLPPVITSARAKLWEYHTE
jgi:hypothetical protein